MTGGMPGSTSILGSAGRVADAFVGDCDGPADGPAKSAPEVAIDEWSINSCGSEGRASAETPDDDAWMPGAEVPEPEHPASRSAATSAITERRRFLMALAFPTPMVFR